MNNWWKSWKSWIVIVACGGIGVFITSCADTPNAFIPVLMPGAEYVGTETCAECHENEYAYFKRSPHAEVSLAFSPGLNEKNISGCETCHGPGSLHVDGEGDKTKIVRNSADACFSCHLNERAKFSLQHHHPVPEGRLNCSSCHNLHGKDVRATAGARLARRGVYDKCVNCHKEQKGPYVFEHEAMRQGCGACHTPHGSVQDKLLVAGQSVVCLRCHFDINTNTVGGMNTGVQHGTAGENVGVGRGEECIDHHRAPHGSNLLRTLNH